MNISSTILTLKPERVHLYSQGWWGSNSHLDIGYRSDNPAIVRMQVESSAAVVAPAILNTVPAWYSPTNEPNNTYCRLLRAESERRGSQFAIMMPPTPSWVKEDPKTLVAYLRANYFGSPAYAQLNGKLMFWSFNAPPAILNLLKAQPDILILTENSGLNSYAWPNGFPPNDSPQKYMQRYLSGKGLLIPCLWRLFDDHKANAPTESAWGGPARYMAAGKTSWDLWNSLATVIQNTGRTFPELGLTGLDDYEEGTRLEPWIYQEYAQMLSVTGKSLQADNSRKDIG